MDLMRKAQVKKLVEMLSFFYDCDLEFLKSFSFYLNKSGKVYITNSDFESLRLERVSSVGLYFGTFHDEERFRLSIEGSKFVKAKKNFVVLNEGSFKSYICGENLFKDEVVQIDWQDNCPFLIVVYGDENLGCVNVKGDEILTYVPKSRKLDFNRVF